MHPLTVPRPPPRPGPLRPLHIHAIPKDSACCLQTFHADQTQTLCIWEVNGPALREGACPLATATPTKGRGNSPTTYITGRVHEWTSHTTTAQAHHGAQNTLQFKLQTCVKETQSGSRLWVVGWAPPMNAIPFSSSEAGGASISVLLCLSLLPSQEIVPQDHKGPETQKPSPWSVGA